jgi:hypothetical protein
VRRSLRKNQLIGAKANIFCVLDDGNCVNRLVKLKRFELFAQSVVRLYRGSLKALSFLPEKFTKKPNRKKKRTFR